MKLRLIQMHGMERTYFGFSSLFRDHGPHGNRHVA